MSTTTHVACEDCGQIMDPGTGCSETHVAKWKSGPFVARIRVGEGDDWGAPVCHDCNASTGQVHHAGCDVERCPECGGQMIGCFGEEFEVDGVHFASCGWLYLGKEK